MMSMKVLAPSFIFAIGSPVMLPERSRTSAMSVGLVAMSGAAVSASVTRSEPSQSMRSALTSLLELVIPMSFLLLRVRNILFPAPCKCAIM